MPSKAARVWFPIVCVLLIASSAMFLRSSETAGAANGDAATATYSEGILRVMLPHESPHAGAGRLVVELLNPEDEVLGHVERVVEAGVGRRVGRRS
jgi:hypothetical protein